jgi:hypothetical protein
MVNAGAVRGHSELEAFVGLPYRLHRGSTVWSPPLRRDVRALLDPARNPFFDHAERELFLARLGGRVVGRIAAISDRLHDETHGDRVGFFGFFESVDDPAVARALFDAANDWLRARQRDTLRGPVSPSINDEAGLLVDGFETPSVLMMPHNPRYYPALVERGLPQGQGPPGLPEHRHSAAAAPRRGDGRRPAALRGDVPHQRAHADGLRGLQDLPHI